jgi:hypothetical protein
VEAVLDASRETIDNHIFLYQKPDLSWEPSSVYRYRGFLDGLRVMYRTGVANRYFYLGPAGGAPRGHRYGLVNVAAFLAQSMKETIQYDACDENNWDRQDGRYPLSNACGQLEGQSYQDYHCSSPDEAHMECPVDPNMRLTAVTHARWYGAPGPLKCGPRGVYPFTGYWDHNYQCNRPWDDPPETCTVYDGQMGGGENNGAPVENRGGRTDVEGCCWWGRGVIQTTGICNFGKLNYYLGKRAADEGRPSMYPALDFCADPEVICSSEEHTELKWIAGMFYWIESVQSYNSSDGGGEWNYLTKLHEFVDGGHIMSSDDNSFIDAVSGIVNRGCHNPPCKTGDVDGREERRANFRKVLDAFFGSLLPDDNGGGPSTAPVTSLPLPTAAPVTPEPATATPIATPVVPTATAAPIVTPEPSSTTTAPTAPAPTTTGGPATPDPAATAPTSPPRAQIGTLYVINVVVH